MLNHNIKGRKRIVSSTKSFWCCQLLVRFGKYKIRRAMLCCKSRGSVFSFLFEHSSNSLAVGLYDKLHLLTTPTSFELRFGGRTIIRAFGNPKALASKLVGPSNCAPTAINQNRRHCLEVYGNLGFDQDEYSASLPNKKVNCDSIRVPEISLLFGKRLLVNAQEYDKLSTFWGLSSPSFRKAKRVVRSITKATYTIKTEMPLVVAKGKIIRRASSPKGASFIRSVGRVSEDIKRGGIMQLQVGLRFSFALKAYGTAEIRRVTSHLNPTPFSFEFCFNYYKLIGASPEIQIRTVIREEGLLTIKPIAGTRPRSSVKWQDQMLGCELINSPKEVAEHIMLIDLARNDLSKILAASEGRIERPIKVEQYSHVQHLVSVVRFHANKQLGSWETISSSFPAGTVVGTPKQKARILIKKYENVRRSFYGGAVGSISSVGINLAITIRSFLVVGRSLFAQSSAGIVQDSTPLEELRETQNKVVAIICALKDVSEGTIAF
ncbi:anthranilate synthase component I [Candidatus Tremblaya phenacola PAVE]|nr:anthranilate synthase component I [Candidatus Tremblaya phenacola PAVE]